MSTVKDKAYEEHRKAMERDRPKDFKTRARSVKEYVQQWCKKNGLKHEPKAS